ncbi:BrnT family toxin [Roseomonas elaeocarpi]|uniref:BrnT family toxin n=1 Tax=Roseomonas elaeocarpi TaxID=907779 RepID=A0ABV6JTH9_9PROT
MPITFDPAKDAKNLAVHKVSLAFGALVLADAVGVVEDERQNYGETRMKAFAEVGGLWWACVFTVRGDETRIISVHRVKEREARRWLQE